MLRIDPQHTPAVYSFKLRPGVVRSCLVEVHRAGVADTVVIGVGVSHARGAAAPHRSPRRPRCRRRHSGSQDPPKKSFAPVLLAFTYAC